jgi:hypothetical protein
MALFLLLVGLLFGGCGGSEPDFTTIHGIEVYDNSSERYMKGRRAELEQLTAGMIRSVGGGWNSLPKVSVDVVSMLIPSERSASGFATGTYDTGSNVITIVTPLTMGLPEDACLLMTSFLHELTHHYQLVRGETIDPFHTASLWWDVKLPNAKYWASSSCARSEW